MFEKLRPILILILAALALQWVVASKPKALGMEGQSHPQASLEAATPAIQWIPQNAVISLELSDTRALLDLLASERAIEFITSLPTYRKQASNPEFMEFLGVVRYLEVTLGTDWRTGLAKLTGGGIMFAVCPEETVILIVEAEDEQMLNQLHETFLNIAKDEAQKESRPNRVASKQYQDVTAWTFNGEEAHAIIGKRLVLSNRPEGLKAVLDRRAGAGGASLASKPTYRTAKSQIGSGAVATVFADLKLLMQIPDVAQLLEQQSKNPLAALAFAGIVESVRDSNWLALGLDIRDETLILRPMVDGTTIAQTSPAAFALPKEPGDGALQNLPVPRRIAAMTLYRDLHQFYAAKDELFPERTSGLIFFENMMGIFFSGRDLTSEVLAETRPSLRFVVAEQQFDPAIGTPQIKLPAFAVILRLHNPEQAKEVAEEAWQKALGLINFTRGQNALPGLIIDRLVHNQTKFSMAYFSTAQIEDKMKLDTRFNIRPALAMPGDYLILSSTEGLARDLIDALDREKERTVKPLAQTHSLLEIEGRRLASILQANRGVLVRGDMIKKGRTQEQAEAGIDMLITVIRLIERVKLSIGMHEGLTRAQLEMKLNVQ
jgi:hypothetical protein